MYQLPFTLTWPYKRVHMLSVGHHTGYPYYINLIYILLLTAYKVILTIYQCRLVQLQFAINEAFC
jgi:hypothetical protein